MLVNLDVGEACGALCDVHGDGVLCWPAWRIVDPTSDILSNEGVQV